MATTQNKYMTMSAAATISPIVLFSDKYQGNLYLAGKNTFLEFYTDEQKVLKRNAGQRSASADSHFAGSTLTTSTATPTNRSSSPSSSNQSSNEKECQRNAGMHSPGHSPREIAPPLNPIKKSVSFANVSELAGQPKPMNLSEMLPMSPYTFDMPEQAPMPKPMHRAVSWADVTDAQGLAEVVPDMDDLPPFDDIHSEVVAPPNRMAGIKKASSWADVRDSAGYPMMMAPNYQSNSKGYPSDHKEPQVLKPRPKAEVANGSKPAKKQDLKKISKAVAQIGEPVTTLMMRGIPCSFTQDALIQILDDAGLKEKYNFFYLPRGGNRSSNLGYAFINFVEPESAIHCQNAFGGVQLDPARSVKTCTISAADLQGLPALRKHFCRTAVSRGSSGPMFFKERIKA
eukprot:gnl/MRDRNA2_/MRDRNA2_82863_c0_seq1.p1 gnl/MRDRNA2_/MRDRNA2_82863_c0~~gnl/MRDRNA2_/MRDRNA2_82863_c0_seq1.p1  ORF type:complete len:400 (+),score=79.10 gnl/MRDRNA2_/MRDRNA2_82863_c0_seq1:101-1300(+)